ncbi:MAG: hypothetical protein AAFP78_07720 [Pseudomonadota bacterium]
MWWTYPFKVNAALAAMNVPPNAFSSDFRSDMQMAGKALGLTPEETALAIVAKALGIHFPDDVETAIAVWRREGKLDLSKKEMKQALEKMGFAI